MAGLGSGTGEARLCNVTDSLHVPSVKQYGETCIVFITGFDNKNNILMMFRQLAHHLQFSDADTLVRAHLTESRQQWP